jgi:glycosyltransferase involved in cell wall biosynthesis
MKASIVTPTFNCFEMLKFTISSLEKQDIGVKNFEVIVIDDGSTDGTADYLKNYNGTLNVHLVINEKNLGRAKSRNRGISASKNELIIFLDADIEVKSDFIRMHIQEHEHDLCACVGKVLFHPDITHNRYMKYLDKRGSAKMKGGEKLPGKYFRTTNASVPRDVLIKIGCFDENFIHYGGEDTELGMRIADEIPIYYLPEAIGYNSHVRTLERSLDVIRVYGEHSLPYLLKKRPELREDILREGKFYSPILPFVCSSPLYKFFKALAKANLAPSFIHSYLLLCSYREGYKKSFLSS